MFNLISKIKNRKGFTLVELLVVLAVLAIISAIAIPRFAGVQESAKKKADAETLNTIQRALELCITSEGTSSPDPAKEILTVADSGLTYGSIITQTVIAKYLDTTKTKLNSGSVTFSLNPDGTITQTVN